MNTRRFLIAAVLIVLAASSVYGQAPQAPLTGVYHSTDHGGDVEVGRASESWIGGSERAPGNVINAESWNGLKLGTQWRVYCPIITSSILTDDHVDENGNGYRIWRLTFVGGRFWLSGDGPWGGGETDYPGLIDTYIEYRQIVYSKNKPVSSTCVVEMAARFTEYPTVCFLVDVSKCQKRGDTLEKNLPEVYPRFLDQSCEVGPKEGSWSRWFGVTMTVTGCVTPVEETSWGSIKARYQN